MKPKWRKLANLAQEICTLLFRFFVAVFASKGYPFKNIFSIYRAGQASPDVCALLILVIKLTIIYRNHLHIFTL